MKRFLLATVIFGIFAALMMAPVTAKEHKDGGGGGGGSAPPPTNVSDLNECTNQGSITIVGAFNFGYTVEDATIRVGSGWNDCVGFYNIAGNHDALLGAHGEDGAVWGFCDFSGKKVCYINMSEVVRLNMEAHPALSVGEVYKRAIHCHQHEAQLMVGHINILILETY